MDFGPEPGAGPSGPFDWKFPDQAGLELSWRKTESGWVIDYRNREPFRVVIAEKLVVLPSGTHSLIAMSDRSQGRRSVAPELNVWCLRSGGKRTRLARDASTAVLQVPEADCTVQQLQLQLPSGQAEGVRIVAR